MNYVNKNKVKIEKVTFSINFFVYIYIYIYMYIYTYIILRWSDKEYYFFRNSEFHAACATIFSRMNYGQICYNIMVSYFKWRHNTSAGKSSLLSWKLFTWIMVKMYVLYTSHKIHLILKFIETDETSVNLLHNYSKSGCHKYICICKYI